MARNFCLHVGAESQRTHTWVLLNRPVTVPTSPDALKAKPAPRVTRCPRLNPIFFVFRMFPLFLMPYYSIFFRGGPLSWCKCLKSLGKSPRPSKWNRDRKNFNDFAYLERPHLMKGSDSGYLHLHTPTSKSNKFYFFFFFFTFFSCAFVNGTDSTTFTYTILHRPTRRSIDGNSTKCRPR